MAVLLVSHKQFTLNVPQVREGGEGCKIDVFGALVASRQHCVLAFRQGDRMTFHQLVLSVLKHTRYNQLTASLALYVL